MSLISKVQFIKFLFSKKKKSFKQYLEDVFGDVIFINFFASSLLICLSGFQITAITGYDLAKFSLFLLCALIELYMLCYYGEQFIQNVRHEILFIYKVVNSFFFSFKEF